MSKEIISTTFNKGIQKLLNYEQVAEVLGLSPATLRVWVHQKRIPFLKLGRAVRFSPEMVDEIMTKGVE